MLQDRTLPTLKELVIKRRSQNLKERKMLLVILAMLLGLQLIFMNAIILLIVLSSLFKFKCFKVVRIDVLTQLLDFSKYYVTAVLVELLGGIIYIVHRVFSDKDTANFHHENLAFF